MKTFTEHIIALRSRLKKFGVDIDDPTIMLNNNEITVNNSSNIKSTLFKNHISIAYHLVRHKVVAGVVNIRWISMIDNVSDTLTNILTESNRKTLFVD